MRALQGTEEKKLLKNDQLSFIFKAGLLFLVLRYAKDVAFLGQVFLILILIYNDSAIL